MELIIHMVKHTLIDSLKLLPFLFVAFLVIELIEHKFSKKSKELISKSGKFGPLLGSGLGLLPQCGFSVVATNLYITRIISLGTLIAIYLSTSDEMLPILLSEKVPIKTILIFLGIKFIVGLIAGYIIDFLLRNHKKEKITYDICESEHCGCNKGENILKASIIHTLKTLVFIMIISFGINLAFHTLGEEYLPKLFLKDTIFSPLISSLIGLIPNCGASVMLTELYLNGALNAASLLAGLLTNSGVALLVLFRSNKNIKENIFIVGLVYGIGVIAGIILELLPVII